MKNKEKLPVIVMHILQFAFITVINLKNIGKEKTHNLEERHSVDPFYWYIKSRKKIQIHSTKFSDLQNETVYEDMATLVFLLVLSAWLVQVQHTNISSYNTNFIPVPFRASKYDWSH